MHGQVSPTRWSIHQGNRPAMRLHNPLYNGKSETGTPTDLLIAAPETLKDEVAIRNRYPVCTETLART